MNLLLTKEATRLGIPARDQISGVLMTLGIIFMYWSISVYFVLGNYARLGTIVAGFGMICLGALLRAGPKLNRHLGFLACAVLYASLLLALSRVRGHSQWYDPRAMIFIGMTFCIFVSGYLMAREHPGFSGIASHWVFVPTAILCVFFQLAFIRFVQVISVAGANRGYGETELNPIGVANAAGCMACIFMALALANTGLFKRILYLSTVGVLVMIMLSTASRGATLWMGCTILFALFITRSHPYFTFKHKILLLLACLAALPAILLLYNMNFAISERIDILWERFSSMFGFIGGGYAEWDTSVNSREFIWKQYLNSAGDWILVGERNYIHVQYPHNLWLEALVRFGVLGIPLLIIMFYTMYRLCIDTVLNRIPPDNEILIVAILFFFSYLSNLTSHTIDTNRALMLGLGYMLGYYMTIRERMRQPNAAFQPMPPPGQSSAQPFRRP